MNASATKGLGLLVVAPTRCGFHPVGSTSAAVTGLLVLLQRRLQARVVAPAFESGVLPRNRAFFAPLVPEAVT